MKIRVSTEVIPRLIKNPFDFRVFAARDSFFSCSAFSFSALVLETAPTASSSTRMALIILFKMEYHAFGDVKEICQMLSTNDIRGAQLKTYKEGCRKRSYSMRRSRTLSYRIEAL